MKKYWWVTDAAPIKVEAATGLRGVPTPQGGTLVEARDTVREAELTMERLERALRGPGCGCVIVHRPGCPYFNVMT